jgi:transposase
LGFVVCFDSGMSEPLRVRRLSHDEGRRIQQIVRRGSGRTDNSIVKWRRALVVMSSAGGNTVPVIARLVQTSEDRVREMIHRFNELGMRSLDPQWAGGRPRQITTDDEDFIVETAKTRPEKLGSRSRGGVSASSSTSWPSTRLDG